MQENHSYGRFGGVFLETPEMHVFVESRRGPVERQCKIIYADIDRLAELWKENTGAQFQRPAPIDEWEDARLREMVWRLLEGPRHPIETPYTYHNGRCFVNGASRYQMEMLLSWEARTVPLMVRPEHADQIKEAVGVKDSPVIEASQFLSDTRETLVAFQKDCSLAQLYAGRKKNPPDEMQIRKDAEDYASLINIQLEILLIRHRVYQRNTTVVTDEQRDALVEEVRRLLFQKGMIAYFLSRDTTQENVPNWDAGDVESRAMALNFLANNTTGQQRAPYLQKISTDNTEPRPSHPKRPVGAPSHLRIVDSKPDDSL